MELNRKGPGRQDVIGAVGFGKSFGATRCVPVNKQVARQVVAATRKIVFGASRQRGCGCERGFDETSSTRTFAAGTQD